MTEKKAKKRLRKMLNAWTAGSVLSTLAEVFQEEADRARRTGDGTAEEQCRQAEATLIVVGLGLDAVPPR